MLRAIVPLLAASIVGSFACGPRQSGVGGWDLPPLRVDSIEPAVWLEGTRVVVKGDGMVPAGLGTLTATLSGRSGDRDFSATVPLAWEAEDRASFRVDPALLALTGLDGPAIQGTLTVVASGDRGAIEPGQFPFHSELFPASYPPLRA